MPVQEGWNKFTLRSLAVRIKPRASLKPNIERCGKLKLSLCELKTDWLEVFLLRKSAHALRFNPIIKR